MNEKGQEFGPGILGFRTPEDEVYQDLVQKALELGALPESERVYSAGCESGTCHNMLASDLVRERSEQVWNHFQAGGHVYMCGGAQTFGAAIEAAFLDIFQEQGNMNFDEALAHLRGLVDKGQLLEDLAN